MHGRISLLPKNSIKSLSRHKMLNFFFNFPIRNIQKRNETETKLNYYTFAITTLKLKLMDITGTIQWLFPLLYSYAQLSNIIAQNAMDKCVAFPVPI